jgi:LmbE family N-acetylglucosaminyl deacetylase
VRISASDRIVVVSPHLDDAALSLGVTIVRATRSGARVEVLTVFAGDPASETPANGWDRRGGFATQGESAKARRDEDREACRLLGAEPMWLSFSSRAEKDEDLIWPAVADAVRGAEGVLVPGFPLTNEDHAWLGRLLVERGLPCDRTGLYAEQPYRYMVRSERPRLEVPARLEGRLSAALEWTKTGVGIGDYRLKRKAILAYRSQMPMLGFLARRHRKLHRMLFDEAVRGGEALAWLSA